MTFLLPVHASTVMWPAQRTFTSETTLLWRFFYLWSKTSISYSS